MMESAEWGSDETLAWTKRDGMTPPPRGVSPWFLGAVATSMIGVWIGLIATDALCPDHRLWVQTMASVALVGSVAAIVGLFAGRSWAPLMALGSALVGIAIGFVDAVHDPTRGALISLAFTLVGAMLVIVLVPHLRSALWPRRAARDMHVESPKDLGTPASNRSQDMDSRVDAANHTQAVQGPDGDDSPVVPRVNSRE
jgi:hypothetical protein